MSTKHASCPRATPGNGAGRTETMPLKIGVMGGATASRCVLITGACPGLPLAAACGAKQAAAWLSASRRA